MSVPRPVPPRSPAAPRWLAGLLWLAAAGLPGVSAPVDFAHDIVPVLRQHCGECHTGAKQKGGLSFNTRETLLKGGENGPVVKPGDSAHSRLLAVVTASDPDEQMPPKGPRLTAAEVDRLRAWIDGGVAWTEGFAFQPSAYEPPLRPRLPELPRARRGRTNGIDRILDAHLAQAGRRAPAPVDDAAFLRRVSLDLVGLLPEPGALDRFVKSRDRDKRSRAVHELLARDLDYAEHWLTFWNDLLRNDYSGTGYIDDGRRQISAWLYRSLLENKPYDRFARELIAPTAESEGFARGIKWRGAVSAGQTVPVQFAQSVGQSFLGINLKCASCHDSFIDRWTLENAYGLAAIYAEEPLELHRCDQPLGRKASPAWLFPELGQVDGTRPRAERLQQLAGLMTHPENGRFPRTIVNRLWHRLMGRGIVHPLDAMQTPPWNADLLDYLAVHLASSGYDLKATLALIATSAAYQSEAEAVKPGADDRGYAYAGPRPRRLTAEQFVDAVWQITGTAPSKYDAPVRRGRPEASVPPSASWVWWGGAPAGTTPPAGENILLRRQWVLPAAPVAAGVAVTADNSYTLHVNGRRIAGGDDWERVDFAALDEVLRAGTNEVFLAARNGGDSPNPAGAFVEIRWRDAAGRIGTLGTDASWESARGKAGREGHPPAGLEWVPARVVEAASWKDRTAAGLASALAQATAWPRPMVRASLLNSDLLQRTLGRPNREQIVSMRPDALTTLEAMDLSNGSILAGRLGRGAETLAGRFRSAPDDLVTYVYRLALSRPPTRHELGAAREALGRNPTPAGVEDFLWSICLLPEFQFVR